MSFDRKTPDEARILTFDFSTKATSGSTLSNPAVAISHLSGPGDATDLTLATPAVVDQTVTVLASAGLDGARYRLKATADTSDGETLEIDRDLPVSASAALVS